MNKTILKISLVLIFVSLLFSVGCKKNVIYDIAGQWDFEIMMDDGTVFVETYSFAGSIESGDVYYGDQKLGTYTVFDRGVNITISYYDEDDDYNVEIFSGYFDDEYSMSGNYTLYIEDAGPFSGTWNAN